MVHAALTSALQGRSRRLLSYQVSRRPRRASISTGSPKRCSACGRAGAPVGSGTGVGSQLGPQGYPGPALRVPRPPAPSRSDASFLLPSPVGAALPLPRRLSPRAAAARRRLMAGSRGAHARFSRENVSLPFPRPAPSLLGDKSERAARTRLPRLNQSQRGVRAARSPLPSGEPGKGRVLAAQRSQPVFPARSPASHSGGIKAPEEPPSLNARWLKNGNSIRNRASSSRKKRNKLPDFEAASAGRQCGARGRAGCAVEAGGRGAAR